MHLAVTVLTGKSAILFSALQAEGGTSAHAQRHRLIKTTAIIFFSPAGGGTCGAAYGCACAWQSQEIRNFVVWSCLRKTNDIFFLFLRQVEGPAARHTAAHAPGSYSTHRKIRHFVLCSSGV
jgi:hypothetical protein